MPSTVRRPRVKAASAAVGVLLVASVFVATEIPLGRTPYTQISASLVDSGWNEADPVVFFQPLTWDINPIAWYLPAHPVLETGSPTKGTCSTVFVISEDRAGLAWLANHQVLVVGPVRRYPFFGNTPGGRRQPIPVEVARVEDPPGLLAGAQQAGADVLGIESQAMPCLTD